MNSSAIGWHNFDNDEKEILKCPYCGSILDSMYIQRNAYIWEQYDLNPNGKIQYTEEIEVEYANKPNYIVQCGKCEYELSEEQIQKLIDKKILDL